MSTKETKQSGETGTKGKHAKPNKTVTETCDGSVSLVTFTSSHWA